MTLKAFKGAKEAVTLTGHRTQPDYGNARPRERTSVRKGVGGTFCYKGRKCRNGKGLRVGQKSKEGT